MSSNNKSNAPTVFDPHGLLERFQFYCVNNNIEYTIKHSSVTGTVLTVHSVDGDKIEVAISNPTGNITSCVSSNVFFDCEKYFKCFDSFVEALPELRKL